MILTYNKEIREIRERSLAECPPKTATPQRKDAWRWIFYPMDSFCFIPQAIKNPPRLLRAKDPEQECSCWALSMFTNREQGIKAFKQIEKKMRNARKTLGDHIAKGYLSKSSGLCTPANDRGHFDFHPGVEFDFSESFQHVEQIP